LSTKKIIIAGASGSLGTMLLNKKINCNFLNLDAWKTMR